jgi:hypothetical protein
LADDFCAFIPSVIASASQRRGGKQSALPFRNKTAQGKTRGNANGKGIAQMQAGGLPRRYAPRNDEDLDASRFLPRHDKGWTLRVSFCAMAMVHHQLSVAAHSAVRL